MICGSFFDVKTWYNFGTNCIVDHIDGLMLEKRNSSALAMELRLFLH